MTQNPYSSQNEGKISPRGGLSEEDGSSAPSFVPAASAVIDVKT